MHSMFDLAGTVVYLVNFSWLPGPMRPFFMTLALILIIYVFYVRPRIRQYRILTGVLDTIDTSPASLWGRIWERIWGTISARLRGYKTVILGSLAALMPQVPPILDVFNSFAGWSIFLDQGLADKISAVLAAATAITHVYGLLSAAKIVPADAIRPSPEA